MVATSRKKQPAQPKADTWETRPTVFVVVPGKRTPAQAAAFARFWASVLPRLHVE